MFQKLGGGTWVSSFTTPLVQDDITFSVNAGDSGQGGKAESDTIIVNVITEKAKNAAAAGSGSKATKGDSNVKEEQV